MSELQRLRAAHGAVPGPDAEATTRARAGLDEAIAGRARETRPGRATGRVRRAGAPGLHEAAGTGSRGWRRAGAALRRRRQGRGLAIGLAALVVTGSAMAAVIHVVTQPSKAPYDVSRYLGHGDAFDCTSFPSQAFAQAVLRADPSDPNQLDEEPGGVAAERDGIACPGLPVPRDLAPVQAIVRALTCHPGDGRSARCPQPSRPFDARDYVIYGIDEYDCSALASQADAQAVLRFTPTDPDDLDGDRDGIACPRLPAPKDLRRVARGPGS